LKRRRDAVGARLVFAAEHRHSHPHNRRPMNFRRKWADVVDEDGLCLIEVGSSLQEWNGYRNGHDQVTGTRMATEQAVEADPRNNEMPGSIQGKA
jgi:hypothetical protein